MSSTGAISRLSAALAKLSLLLGIAAAVCALALALRCYMPCPNWDQWEFIDAIARGEGPWSWSWLWSQHNEHRLAMTRVLVSLDLFAFGGKNVSLFIEMFLVQIAHWGIFCYVIERFTDLPSSVKRTIEGLLAFCLFHLNQAENFTWAFQVSWMIAFALVTVSLAVVVFFFRLRRPVPTIVFVALSPILAAVNVSAGLLIGIATSILALLKRLPKWACVTIVAVFALSALAYLYGYRVPEVDSSRWRGISWVKELFVYVLTYFGASWTKLVPHKERPAALLSLIYFVAVVVRSVRNRERIADFEWFLQGECAFMLAFAFVTGVGRLHLGVGQAYASRYQIAAMLYWGSLFSLLLVRTWRKWPARFPVAQTSVAILVLLSLSTFPSIWTTSVKRADMLRNACSAVMSGHYDRATAEKLYPSGPAVARSAALLRKVWQH